MVLDCYVLSRRHQGPLSDQVGVDKLHFIFTTIKPTSSQPIMAFNVSADKFTVTIDRLAAGMRAPSSTATHANALFKSAMFFYASLMHPETKRLFASSQGPLILSKLEGLAQNLATLDDQLYTVLSGLVHQEAGSVLCNQLHAGVIAAEVCCSAGAQLSAAGNTAFRLAASAKLVLRSGGFLLAHLRTVGQRASALQKLQHVAALDQVKAASKALCVLRDSNAAGLRAFLATTAAPAVSIPWLEALLDVLVGMPRAAWGSEKDRLLVLEQATATVRIFLFGGSQTALPAAQPRLEGRLGEAAARLLLHEALPDLAAACQQAPLPLGTNMFLENFKVLSSGLRTALEREMAGSDSGLHLQHAAKVASALALGCPDGSTNAAAQVAAATIVATLCRSVCSPVRERSGSCPEAAARVDAAFWQVLGLLPDVLAAVRAMAARGVEEMAPGGPHLFICHCYTGCLDEIVMAMEHLDHPQLSSFQSEEQLELWAAAADAALRTLPLLVECEAGWRQLEGGSGYGLSLRGCLTAHVWCRGAAAAEAFLRSASCRTAASQHERISQLLWQLHSRACRLVHRLLPPVAPGSSAAARGGSRDGSGSGEGGPSQQSWANSHWPSFEQGLYALAQACTGAPPAAGQALPERQAAAGTSSKVQAFHAAHWAATRQLAERLPLLHPPATDCGAGGATGDGDQAAMHNAHCMALCIRAMLLADIALHYAQAAAADAAIIGLLRQAVEVLLAETEPVYVAAQRLLLQTLKAAADERDFIAAQMAAGGLLAVLLEAAGARPEIRSVAGACLQLVSTVYRKISDGVELLLCGSYVAPGSSGTGPPASRATVPDTRPLMEACQHVRQAVGAPLTLAARQESVAKCRAALEPATLLAALLLQKWGASADPAANRLAAAQAAAMRSCAFLACSNLEQEGGPAAGQGKGSRRCGGCRAVWYCGTACSHADWKAGHKRVCKELAAAQWQQRERQEPQEG